MRGILIALFTVVVTGTLSAGEVDSEMRALAERRAKLFEIVAEFNEMLFERGQVNVEVAVESNECLFKAKMDLAATPAERLTLAENYVKLTEEFAQLTSSREAAGRVTKSDVGAAQLYALDAVRLLLEEKKQNTPEKLRELTEQKLKVLEEGFQNTWKSFERGLSDQESLEMWTTRLNETRMVLAKPKERMAIAQKRFDDAKSFHELSVARENAGQIIKPQVLQAELQVIEAEIALLQEKKQDASEKMRAHAAARLKCMAFKAEAGIIMFERNLGPLWPAVRAGSELRKLKMEAAATSEERVALAELELKTAKEYHSETIKREEQGQVIKSDVALSELMVVDAEESLLLARKK
jgi:hypothetical protein